MLPLSAAVSTRVVCEEEGRSSAGTPPSKEELEEREALQRELVKCLRSHWRLAAGVVQGLCVEAGRKAAKVFGKWLASREGAEVMAAGVRVVHGVCLEHSLGQVVERKGEAVAVVWGRGQDAPKEEAAEAPAPATADAVAGAEDDEDGRCAAEPAAAASTAAVVETGTAEEAEAVGEAQVEQGANGQSQSVGDDPSSHASSITLLVDTSRLPEVLKCMAQVLCQWATLWPLESLAGPSAASSWLRQLQHMLQSSALGFPGAASLLTLPQ